MGPVGPTGPEGLAGTPGAEGPQGPQGVSGVAPSRGPGTGLGAIRRAAEELNYQPNHVARSLAVRETKTIGLILTDIMNPTLTETADGTLQRVLHEVVDDIKSGQTFHEAVDGHGVEFLGDEHGPMCDCFANSTDFKPVAQCAQGGPMPVLPSVSQANQTDAKLHGAM